MPARSRVTTSGGRNLGGPPTGRQGDVYVNASDGSLNVHDGAKFAPPKLKGLTMVAGAALLAEDAGTDTAVGTGGTSTATVSKQSGVITSGAITTAAAADHVMTVTNTLVTATSKIVASIHKNGSTGWPVITSIEPGAGSFVIRITNMHASAAFNAALKIAFRVAA